MPTNPKGLRRLLGFKKQSSKLKIFSLMKLVSIHKLFFTLLFLSIAWSNSSAQVWSVQQCIDTAYQHNNYLQISQNNIALKKLIEKEAKANLIPKIVIQSDYKYFISLPYQLLPAAVFGGQEGHFREAQFGVPHNINANVQFTMPLYNANLQGAIQNTKIASELTELSFLKNKDDVFFQISNLYYNAQILHHQLSFIDSNLINSERLLTNIKILKEQLLAKKTDVEKVSLQVEQAKTQKAAIQTKYTQVVNTLKLIIGIPIEQNIEIETQIEYKKTAEYTTSTNLDVRIIQTKQKLLENELKTLNRSKNLPSINLLGSYGLTGFGYDEKPNDFLKFFRVGFVGIQFSYTVFNGMVTQQKINQKNIELQNNTLQSDWLTNQNITQIENAKLQKITMQQSVEMTKKHINLAQNIYQETLQQQKQGTANLTNIILAENALHLAQQTYLSALIDYLKADLELKKLTGNTNTVTD